MADNRVIVELGTVIKNRGEWDSLAQNAKLYKDNVVQYNGSAYIVKSAPSSGIGKDILPTNTAYYEVFAGVGEVATGSDFDAPSAAQRGKITTVGAVLDGMNDGVYNLTAKTGDSYATLNDALIAANNTIPTNKKRGGMSICFVNSTDHKYVSFRLTADEWSINTNDWSFCGDNVLVENPEWIYVLLDAEKRILAGLKSDGSVEWSIGVPTPVKTYIANAIAEIKNGTEGTDIDGLNKIITFLSEFSTSDTLKDLLDTKVDKVEGKSLIDAEFAEGVSQAENPEFIEVRLDVEDKILWAIRADGDIYFGVGVPTQVKDYIQSKIAELGLDKVEDIITFLGDLVEGNTLATLLNGKVDKVTGKSLIDAQYATSQEVVSNPEYLQATTDSESRVLQGIKLDGTFFIGGDLDLKNRFIQLIDNPEYIVVTIDKEGKLIDGIKKDGSHYIYNIQSEPIDAIKDTVDNHSLKLSTIKRVSILGDSISTFNKVGFKIDGYSIWYPTAPEDRGHDVISVEDTWWKQVINNLGAIIDVNASYSGSTASNFSVGFSPRVSLLGNPDVIFIALGTNDSAREVEIGEINFSASEYDLSKFAPAYIKGIQDTISTYPKAEIICVAFDMGLNYRNAIQTIAQHYGLKYIYVGDITDVHPNKSEMKAAAMKVTDTLNFEMLSLALKMLPVSDGSTVGSGQAYIDSNDRTIKVKE